MISALRKLAKKDETKSQVSMPSGVFSMDQSLQRKFGRGVQYNMKIIVKGDRNTGKSTLFGRFQGKPFKEEYLPTNEIQVCSINWNYRVADDVVKVEVWDVVDKGKKKSKKDGLKLANDFSSTKDQIPGILDAEFLDVYKGTHGCIMMMDITKLWTFKYIERELPKIPDHIPVLVLANFLDMEEHRVVQLDEITAFVKNLDRSETAAVVEYGECCMKNSFGLKFIHKFFNIPFLKLQRETLEKQLRVNQEDMQATLEELSFHRNSEEQNYQKYLAYIEKKVADKKQPKPPAALGNGVKSSPSSTASSSSTSLKSPLVSGHKTGSSKKDALPAKNIDDFVPNETIDSGFLGETDKVDFKSANAESTSDDGESDEGNPMVSGFQDISSEDEDRRAKPQNHRTNQPNANDDVDIEITSDESEKEVENSPVVYSPNQNATEGQMRSSSSEEPVEDNEDNLGTSKTAKPEALKLVAKADLIFNDQDNNFMDAWLDSPGTTLPSTKSSSEKSGLDLGQTTGLLGDYDLELKNRHLRSKTSVNKPDEDDENSSGDVNEEKKRRHSEKKLKEGEEGKHKHRSKHKHKKKTKTKDADEEESGEKRSKSKKKHRHKHSKSKEKSETVGNGEDYESF